MVNLKVDINNLITKDLERIQKDLANLPKEAYDYFKGITPIRTGNARRNTKLKNDTIEANYPYAQRLDDGYSKQAPDGMTMPTEKFIDKQVRKIMKKGK